MTLPKLIFTTNWKIDNFTTFFGHNSNNNSDRPSFLSSPIFRVPSNHKWKLYFTLHPDCIENLGEKSEFLSLFLHVHDGPLDGIQVDCKIEVLINNVPKLVEKTFEKNKLKIDFELKCLQFIKKSDLDLPTDQNKEKNYVFSIRCLFYQFLDSTSSYQKPVIVPRQISIKSQAKVKLTKAECFGEIKNFNKKIKQPKSNKATISCKFDILDGREKHSCYDMEIWLTGRWNILNPFISVELRAENTLTEFENAHSKISIYSNQEAYHTKVLAGVLSKTEATNLKCDKFIKTKDAEKYLLDDILIIKSELEILKPEIDDNNPSHQPTNHQTIILLMNETLDCSNSNFTNSNLLAGSTQNTRDMTQTANQNKKNFVCNPF